MDFYFHEEAEAELIAAIDYYERREKGLGIRFAEEVSATIQRICAFPQTWEKIDDTIHRCLTNKISLWHPLQNFRKSHRNNGHNALA